MALYPRRSSYQLFVHPFFGGLRSCSRRSRPGTRPLARGAFGSRAFLRSGLCRGSTKSRAGAHRRCVARALPGPLASSGNRGLGMMPARSDAGAPVPLPLGTTTVDESMGGLIAMDHERTLAANSYSHPTRSVRGRGEERRPSAVMRQALQISAARPGGGIHPEACSTAHTIGRRYVKVSTPATTLNGPKSPARYSIETSFAEGGRSPGWFTLCAPDPYAAPMECKHGDHSR
jgi:hypothetical protein